MTWVVYRDGPPKNYSLEAIWAILGLFWLATVALFIFSASQPCFELKIESTNRVSARWRYPFRVVRRTFIKSNLNPASVVDSKDSEGDRYYIARVVTSDGTALDFAGGHVRITRITCEQACSKFNTLVFPGHIGA